MLSSAFRVLFQLTRWLQVPISTKLRMNASSVFVWRLRRDRPVNENNNIGNASAACKIGPCATLAPEIYSAGVVEDPIANVLWMTLYAPWLTGKYSPC